MNNDEIETKTEFVKKHLSPLLQAADLRIHNAKYRVHPESHEEIVSVVYESGFVRDVCVTADSLRAIVDDVMAAV